MDAFEEQMREHAPSWSAFDIRKGAVAKLDDVLS
jgi:hypothetical protein